MNHLTLLLRLLCSNQLLLPLYIPTKSSKESGIDNESRKKTKQGFSSNWGCLISPPFLLNGPQKAQRMLFRMKMRCPSLSHNTNKKNT
ncbi:unnamed protein product [Linum tenue]|uniref:Secreted protein n=1 Tax=Linum tenue TaxID=586396 RepID=A0AAV0PZN4_9ROSI|nr:unnamed protein product [Linum tenue]